MVKIGRRTYVAQANKEDIDLFRHAVRMCLVSSKLLYTTATWLRKVELKEWEQLNIQTRQKIEQGFPTALARLYNQLPLQ